MGDTSAMEERRRKLEEQTICGCFGHSYVPPKWWQFRRRWRAWRYRRRSDRFFKRGFKFPKVNATFPQLKAEDIVSVQPMYDPNVFCGTIKLRGPALGSLFAGKTAGELRAEGHQLEGNIPDYAVCTELGTFDWLRIEFNLSPRRKTDG